MILKRKKPAYSFGSGRQVARKKTKRILKRGRRNLRWALVVKRVLFWVLFAAFLATCFWTVFLSSVMQVDQVNLVNQRIGRLEIEQLVRQRTEGKYFGIFPKNNLLLIPTRQIQRDIRNNFKLVKEVDVSRVFPKAIMVQLKERESVMTWCHAGDCFLVDELGTVFYKLTPNDEELSDEQIIRMEDKSQVAIELGKNIVQEKEMVFFLSLPSKIEHQTGIVVEKNFYTPSAMSMEVKLRTKQGWELLLNVAEPLDTQVGTLKKIVDEKIPKDKLSQLEYIDLRLRGRAVYKFRQSGVEEEAGEGQPGGDGQPGETGQEGANQENFTQGGVSDSQRREAVVEGAATERTKENDRQKDDDNRERKNKDDQKERKTRKDT